MEKRKEKRVNKKLMVNFSLDGLENLGITSNISKKGMSIALTEMFYSNKNISIFIALPKDVLNIKGKVKWSKKFHNRFSGDIVGGMGVRITESPPEYLDYLETIYV